MVKNLLLLSLLLLPCSSLFGMEKRKRDKAESEHVTKKSRIEQYQGTWEDLPSEIKAMIFIEVACNDSPIKGLKELKNLALVSKECGALANDDSLLKRIIRLWMTYDEKTKRKKEKKETLFILVMACGNGDHKLFSLLHEAGISLNQVCALIGPGRNALEYAVEKNQLAMVKELLSQGALDGGVLFFILSNNFELNKLLLSYGVLHSLANDVLLHQCMCAILGDDIQRVKIILEKNPQLCNAKGEYQRTVLIYASIVNNCELAEWLIAHGADVNYESQGESALQIAKLSNFHELVELLMRHGAKHEQKS